MKTLIITLEYPPRVGGIASYVYNLAAHLNPDETVVYAPRSVGDKEFDAKQNWPTYRRDPYLLFFWPRWLALFYQVWRIVSQEKITQIYVNHALPVGYAAYLIKKLKKIPYTIFFHGSDVETNTRNALKRRELQIVCREAKQIIVNSEYLKNKLIQRIEGLVNLKIIYPAPADIFFAPAKASEVESVKAELGLKGKKALISVGRMAEGKGFPHLIRIFSKVLVAVPNAVLILVGGGPKENFVTDLIQQYNLSSVIRVTGELPSIRLPAFYQASDVFALLTHPDESYAEGWGTVFLEAAASGLPSVAGRSGGAAEAVVDGVTGLVVDVHQEQSVLNAIIELLNNPDRARQMGEAGRERVQREFTWEKQIRKLEISPDFAMAQNRGSSIPANRNREN